MTELGLVEKIDAKTKLVLFFVPTYKNTIAISVSQDLLDFFIMQEEQNEEVSFYLIDIENKKIVREEDF
ncbi:hypothetical protein HB837_14595 [Listeria innocua]|uniref:hypothetical protein n=1 Tax=Listeria innocua TaxID=1642 RepID=UPI0016246832|nr:hypothetical protein [Listeria innocua]MBC1339425.1 hypothetical protein [Listeria innocua]MBC1353665.1 hypothetical protein [Listeria innocua]